MRSEKEMVAYALEAPTALLRYLPELLVDLEELGSDAEAIARVLDDLNPVASTTVADLGCGKGAVAVKVAERFNIEVTGIDLFEPFMKNCQELAESRGVAALCRFIHGDILKLAGKLKPFDIAIYAALGDVLGAPDRTVAIIRRYVKAGGYIVINDGFIKDGGSSAFAGFEQYADREAMVARLTACGDELVQEIVGARTGNGREGELITARARAIAARWPEIADDVLAYGKAQVAEYEYMEGNFVSAIWVLKRSQ